MNIYPSKNRTGTRAGVYYAVFIAVFIVVTFLLQTVASLFSKRGSAVYYAVSSLSAPISLATVLILAKKFFSESESAANLCGVKKYSRSFTGIAVILSFGMLFGLGFINDAFVKLLKTVGINTPDIPFSISGAGEFILCIFSLCVIPAVSEELFFRGVLLSSLKNSGIIAASLVSALFFAVYHCSPAQLVYQFIFGFMLAVLARRANSVLPSIIAHFLNNIAVLSLYYFKVYLDVYNPLYIILGIGYLAVFSFVLTIFKTEKRVHDKKSVTEAFVPFGIIGLAICVLIGALDLFL